MYQHTSKWIHLTVGLLQKFEDPKAFSPTYKSRGGRGTERWRSSSYPAGDVSQWERFLGLYKALGSVPLEGIERQGEGERKEGGEPSWRLGDGVVLLHRWKWTLGGPGWKRGEATEETDREGREGKPPRKWIEKAVQGDRWETGFDKDGRCLSCCRWQFNCNPWMQIDMKLGFKGWCDSEASRIGDETGTQVQGMTASWAERGAAPGDKAVSQAVPSLVLHHATRGMRRLSFPTRPCISHKAHPLHFSGCHIPTAPQRGEII